LCEKIQLQRLLADLALEPGDAVLRQHQRIGTPTPGGAGSGGRSTKCSPARGRPRPRSAAIPPRRTASRHW